MILAFFSSARMILLERHESPASCNYSLPSIYVNPREWIKVNIYRGVNKSITTHPQKRMNSTYIVSGGPQKCPTHPAKRMNSTGFGVRS